MLKEARAGGEYMQEYWKPIEGFENYEVSNLGQVRSFYTREAKVLKPSINKDGYLKVGLRKDGKQYLKSIHRLVATAFIPNPEDKLQVNHIDGDKQNNTVFNLEWVTCKENIQHAWNTGLSRMTKEQKKKLSESHKGKYTGKYKSAGKLPTGEKLVWRYAEDLKEKIK